MTNEAVLLREVALPVSFTVADGTGIEKGTLLKLSDLNTAAKSDGEGDFVAGIAAQEKIASNGQNKLAVYDRGDFRVTASGDIALGDPVGMDGDGGLNYVYSLVGDGQVLSGNVVLGHAKELATDEETFRIELHPQTLVDTRA